MRALADLVPRSGHAVLLLGSNAVPVVGVFGLSWPAAGGLMLYWIESVLALGATLLLLSLYARRARAPERAEERAAIVAKGLRTRDVLLFQGSALAIFGLFFGGFVFILVSNRHVESSGLREALVGIPPLAAIAVAALAIDLVRFRRLTANDLQARVDAGDRRFALFWLVGFVGTIAAVMLARPLLVFTIFAVLKTLFELGAAFERRPATIGSGAPPASL